MKLLRITVLVIFILSTVSFTWYKYYEFNNQDTTGPEITYQENTIITSVAVAEDDLLKDVKANDKEDGDVTKSVFIEKISNIALNKRIITYAAIDSSNNIATKNRELIYSDYTSPRFTLTKPLIFYVGEYDSILNNIKAFDSIDKDLTDKIKYEISDFYYAETEGIYEARFQVTNSIGDTAILPTTVEFRYPNLDSKDKEPEIILKGYLVYLKVGDSFNARDYIDKVKIGQKEYYIQEDQPGVVSGGALSMNAISVQSNINLKESGVYEINYSMTTTSGYQGTTKLLVVVEE